MQRVYVNKMCKILKLMCNTCIIALRGDEMSKVNLTISIDDKDKESFNKLVAEIGINTSSAINMFIKQSIREQRLPLNLSLNEKEKNFIDTEKVSEKIMDKYDFAFKELSK